MSFWDKWTKKKIKKVAKETADMSKYIHKLERKLKKRKHKN
jgi:alkyl sulfatase BDS1-like metallo-beta-lactamase superfamily hydrolase